MMFEELERFVTGHLGRGVSAPRRQCRHEKLKHNHRWRHRLRVFPRLGSSPLGTLVAAAFRETEIIGAITMEIVGLAMAAGSLLPNLDALQDASRASEG